MSSLHHVVVLGPQTPTTQLDELVLFDSALSASDHAELFALRNVGLGEDPQRLYGWEEAYGPEYPYTEGDLPVLQNGLCRLRWVPDTRTLAHDYWLPGGGYVEAGRYAVYSQQSAVSGSGAAWEQHAELEPQGVQLVEWTPDRAVLHVVAHTVEVPTSRSEWYVTLQRGWRGPRIEVYTTPRAGQPQNVQVRWAPYYDTATEPLWAGMAGSGGGSQQDTLGSWAGTSLARQSEPWLAAVQADVLQALAMARQGTKVMLYTDSVVYDTPRAALAVVADGTLAGYVSVQAAVAQLLGRRLEAETYARAGLVLAAGSGARGTAITESQATDAVATATWPAGRVAVPAGRYAVWARVRVGTAGATASVRALFTGDAGTATATTTSQTFVWLYLGETLRDDVAADTLDVHVWRSAGTGSTYLDAVVLAATERRQAGDAQYDGVRDHAGAALWDARAVPVLVSR